jgi:hypothetical protein
MKVPMIDGRDFRRSDTYPAIATTGVAIVNEAFAKEYFPDENPIGKWFERASGLNRPRFQVVGLVRDARYQTLREPLTPTAYVPFRLDAPGESSGNGTFIVRTSSSNPLALASMLRREVSRARPEFRVSNIRTQAEPVEAETVRERLLAMLALFFGVVALLLAGVGLYGVLDYSVLQRRREIGIRIAIGAQPGGIVRLVTTQIFAMVAVGALAGVGFGMMSVRYIESLLYEVKATDPGALGLTAVIILTAALLASLNKEG